MAPPWPPPFRSFSVPTFYASKRGPFYLYLFCLNMRYGFCFNFPTSDGLTSRFFHNQSLLNHSESAYTRCSRMRTVLSPLLSYWCDMSSYNAVSLNGGRQRHKFPTSAVVLFRDRFIFQESILRRRFFLGLHGFSMSVVLRTPSYFTSASSAR